MANATLATLEAMSEKTSDTRSGLAHAGSWLDVDDYDRGDSKSFSWCIGYWILANFCCYFSYFYFEYSSHHYYYS